MVRLLDRRDCAAAAAVAALLFGLYLATLYRTVPPGDGGELIVAAHTLGVAHPPGYPLLTLLGKAATFFPAPGPWGSIAARVNALSALLQAIAAGLLVLFLRVTTGRLLPALVAALAFGVAPRPWRYATQAEVFALNDAFAAAVLLVSGIVWARTERAVETGRPEDLHEGPLLGGLAFLFGLSLTNQHTIGFALGPALVLFLLVREARVRRGLGVRSLTLRRGVTGLALFLLGLLPYAYLPLAASRHPFLNFDDPSTPAGFLSSITRRDYGTLSLGLDRPAAEVIGPVAQLGLALRVVVADLTPPSAVFAACAVFAALRRPERWIPLTAAAAGALGFFLLVRTPAEPPLYRSIVERFYLLPILLAAVLSGMGLAWICARLPRRLGNAIGACALAGVAALAASRYRSLDQSENRMTRAFASNVLACLEPGTLLLIAGDQANNALAYATLVEGERPDVALLDQRMLRFEWYVRNQKARGGVEIPFATLTGEPGADLLALVEANRASRPIAFFWYATDSSLSRRYVARPCGMVERLYPLEAFPTLEETEEAHDAAMARLDLTAIARSFSSGGFESLLPGVHVEGDRSIARAWERRNELERARRRLEKAASRIPAFPDPYRSLAEFHLYRCTGESRDDRAARQALLDLRDRTAAGSADHVWAKQMLCALPSPP
jgi:hypothetical protein